MTGIEQVIARAGSASAVARKLKVSHQVVTRWRQRGFVPASRAIELEVAYQVPARELVDPALAHIATLIS